MILRPVCLFLLRPSPCRCMNSHADDASPVATLDGMLGLDCSSSSSSARIWRALIRQRREGEQLLSVRDEESAWPVGQRRLVRELCGVALQEGAPIARARLSAQVRVHQALRSLRNGAHLFLSVQQRRILQRRILQRRIRWQQRRILWAAPLGRSFGSSGETVQSHLPRVRWQTAAASFPSRSFGRELFLAGALFGGSSLWRELSGALSPGAQGREAKKKGREALANERCAERCAARFAQIFAEKCAARCTERYAARCVERCAQEMQREMCWCGEMC